MMQLRQSTPQEKTGPLLKRMGGSYLLPHWPRVVIAFLFMGVAAAMTGLFAKLIEPMIDHVFADKQASLLLPLGGAVLTAFILRGMATYIHVVILNAVGQRMVADLQKETHSHLMRADLEFFHNVTSGELISRITSDIAQIRQAVAECLTSAGKSTLTLIFLVGVMFYQNWRLAMVAFIAFPLAAGVVARMGKRIRKAAMMTQAEMGSFASLLNQTFQSVRHVKAYGTEPFEERRAAEKVDRLYELNCKTFRISAMTTPITEGLSGLGIVAVLIYGGWLIIHGESTTGALMSFIAAFLMAYEPMKRMAKFNATLQAGLAASERIFELLDVHPQIREAENAVQLQMISPTITLEQVHFRYPTGKSALNGISLDVPAGATAALVGPSGAGKSTILNLIPRFYDVEQGAVVVGGMDIRNVTIESLRRHLSLVSQEVAIFDGTILENIAYGSEHATMEKIIEAATAAAAHHFIMEMEHGYQTLVGENGLKLSGGQRQRIAIARAILRDAPILLLDEATSSLDAESEKSVQEALKHLRHGRTTLVIAHRLSTIIDADVIYVIDNGQVVESGNHQELLNQGGVYSRLYHLQSGLNTLPNPSAARKDKTLSAKLGFLQDLLGVIRAR